jgi:MFS family permease
LFGTAYGGVMPLYAVLAREYFGPRIMGTVFGAATMVTSLGMAFGRWAGGMIFDMFGNYTWLYIGSLSVGFGAMAVALAFPPLPSPSRERLQPAWYLESQIGIAAHPSRRPLRGLLRMRSSLLKHNNLMLRSERRERLEAWAASDSPIFHSQY